jgi:hypothetical protein
MLVRKLLSNIMPCEAGKPPARLCPYHARCLRCTKWYEKKTMTDLP